MRLDILLKRPFAPLEFRLENELICEAATNALTGIVRDLRESMYAENGGSLELFWSADLKLGSNAWACSRGSIAEPPRHEIFITYQLACDLYRDAEAYCGFMRCERSRERLQAFLPKSGFPLGPSGDIEEDVAINNMFMASLTWVFFHELGHCSQEHKYIRQAYCSSYKSDQVCEIAPPESAVSQQDATIYHVTELAADAEATAWCISELTRHFLAPHITDACGNLLSQEEIDPNNTGFREFRANLYLFICGISMVLCRFHGRRDMALTPLPVSSHPLPQRRLEMILPQIWEKLDLRGNESQLHGASRHELVQIGIGASTSSCLYWLECGQMPMNADILSPQGVLQDPYLHSYWPVIVQAWDQIEFDINRIRRYGSRLGLLGFTDEFRRAIGLRA